MMSKAQDLHMNDVQVLKTASSKELPLIHRRSDLSLREAPMGIRIRDAILAFNIL
jgi:hypothetical protein